MARLFARSGLCCESFSGLGARERRDLDVFLARFILERFRPARAANFVHVPLRQHGAKPRAELAAPVKIIEQRFSAALGFAEAIQIGVERIGQLARVGVLPGGVTCDGARGAVQLGAELRDEEIPRRGTAEAARASKREVGCVQGVEMRFDLFSVGRSIWKSLRGAAFERGLKLLAREIPFRWRGGFAPAAFDGGRERRGKLRSGGRRGRGCRDRR